MRDCDVIKAFIAYLQKNGYSELRIDRWPDKEIRSSSEIDAIAGCFAIEHTSIDTLKDQRWNSSWFTQLIGDIESKISDKLWFRLQIALNYWDVSKNLKKHNNLNQIRENLKIWILNQSKQLSDGSHTGIKISGVPFSIDVTKRSDCRPGVFFIRYKIEDDTLSKRTTSLLCRKAKKLFKYPNFIKLLLLESSDIALMNKPKMFGLIRESLATDFLNGIDEIWYADTSMQSIQSIDITFYKFPLDGNSK